MKRKLPWLFMSTCSWPRQDLSQAQVDALAATATEIIETNGGKVTKTETWVSRVSPTRSSATARLTL
jgi:hypothetical protein